MFFSGFLYYWLIWIALIYVIFFLPKSHLHMCIRFVLIGLLIVGTLQLNLGMYTVQMALLYLIVCACIAIYFSNKRILLLIQGLVIAFVYQTYLLYEQVYSINLFVPSLVTELLLFILIINIFERELAKQCILIALAMPLGRVMYDLLLNTYYFEASLGDLQLLDSYILITFLFISRHKLEQVRKRLNSKIVDLKARLGSD